MNQSADLNQRLDRLDRCFGYAIDMDQGIVLDAEFVLHSLEKTSVQYPDEMAKAINRILCSATKNAESVREMRNLVNG